MLCLHPLMQKDHFWQDNRVHFGEGRVSCSQSCFQSQGCRAGALPNYCGSLLFMSASFNAEWPCSAR